MSDRDELARDLFSVYEHAQLWQADERAQRLWAAGWRKKPSYDEVLTAVGAAWDEITEHGPVIEPITDHIMRLLDGPTETGEK